MGPSSRFEQLTGLRFMAALGVVLCHYATVLNLPTATRFLTDFLGSAVTLFFVLSGFVLTHTYESRLTRPVTKLALRRYLVARFARVMPVYWLCLFALLVLYLVLGFGLSLGGAADQTEKVVSFLFNLMALQAWWPDFTVQQYWNAPGWSISSELFFYACFPWLLRCSWLDGSPGRPHTLWLVMLATLFAVFISAGALAQQADAKDRVQLNEWLMYTIRFPLFGLYCFVLGIQLARSFKRFPDLAPGRTKMLAASVSVLVVAWFVSWQKSQHFFGFYLEICAIYLVFTPYYFLLIRYLLVNRGGLVRWLSSSRMVLLGDASYALYLLHWLALCVLINGPLLIRGSTLMAWVVVAGLPAISLIVFRFFENPFRLRIRALAKE